MTGSNIYIFKDPFKAKETLPVFMAKRKKEWVYSEGLQSRGCVAQSDKYLGIHILMRKNSRGERKKRRRTKVGSSGRVLWSWGGGG